jgi:hypothetical protein
MGRKQYIELLRPVCLLMVFPSPLSWPGPHLLRPHRQSLAGDGLGFLDDDAPQMIRTAKPLRVDFVDILGP